MPDLTADDFAAIAQLCADAGEPGMAADLIREGITVEEARDRVDYVGRVRALVTMARTWSGTISADFAEKAIAAKLPLDKVRTSIFDALAAANDAAVISNSRLTGDGRQKPPRK